jgi:hypothetical protein
MYSIYADGVCFYNDTFAVDNMKVINPKLTLEDSAAGSLSVTIPPTNIAYDTIVHMVTDISVMKDGAEIWAGRVLSESKDFWNNRVLLCEGELAFFNDTTQPPAEYHNQTVRGFLETLINIHNSKVAENRQFKIGAVTVTDANDSLYRYTNYEKTIECINEKLIDRLGGHLRVRKVDGVRYLDYLKDYPNTNSQTIEFGKNLLDFTRQWDLTEFATVIVPLGNRLEESSIEALDAYLTVESENDGSIYVKSDSAVAEYGWIEKVVNWDDVSTASALLSKAKAYLSEIQFDDMYIELSALDLHYLNLDCEAVKLLDKIRVVSKPHGMDRYFPVTKLVIPLDQPENTQFTLGDTVKTSLTAVNNKTNASIIQQLDQIPKASSILKEAQDNATAIMNMATNGYITITRDDNGTNTLYVTDSMDYTKATKLWKWNLNGLGYSDTGYEGIYKLAMTMDGSIVADRITTGTMYADRIKGGTLKLGGSDEEAGVLEVYDEMDKLVGKWDKDGIKLPEGTKISWENVTGTDGVATKSEIPLKDYITEITENTVSSEYIKGLNLEVGNQITMGSDAYISWSNVTGTPDIPSDDHITKITKDTIETLDITATNIKAGSTISNNFTCNSLTMQGENCHIDIGAAGGDVNNNRLYLVGEANGYRYETGILPSMIYSHDTNGRSIKITTEGISIKDANADPLISISSINDGVAIISAQKDVEFSGLVIANDKLAFPYKGQYIDILATLRWARENNIIQLVDLDNNFV